MTQNGLPDTVEAQLPRIDEIGGLLREPLSSGLSSRATAEKQNEKVEKPDTNCGHGCSHVGPSGSPQNLLNPDYLLIASDDSLAHQQIFRP